MNSQLVSIIMAAYNSESYIRDAITSVMNQTWTNWELLIINDGSTDSTKQVIEEFQDRRIRFFEQSNQGVGSARNIGLRRMNGDFFCFLDADDVFPRNSINSRLAIFKSNPNVSFVDGRVIYVDEKLHPLQKTFVPKFRGMPFNRLIRVDNDCLFGNTWLIKRSPSINYYFETDMTHAEDLYFYLNICNGLNYDYTEDKILLYRQRKDSAMKNIQGLLQGYIKLIEKVKQNHNIDIWQYLSLKIIITKIMVLSFLFDAKDIGSAVSVPFKIWRV